MSATTSAADPPRWATAFAPALVANAAIGFDSLGFERRESCRRVLVSTAHPAKFRETVEPLIGREVPVPESLATLFARPTARTEIEADLGSLRDALREDGTA